MTPDARGVAAAERMDQASRLLANVGELLASSLDYEETLAGVAEFAVRSLADFCIIDVVDGDEMKRLRVAHADPSQADLTEKLLHFPLQRGRPHLSLEALETRRSVLVAEVTDAVLDSLTQCEEHRAVLKALHPRSFMAVPMLARERLLGVLLFVSSRRNYDEEDIATAQKVVQLAAVEVDNARLYSEAQHALQARDRMLGIVAHDLRNPLNTISMSAELLLDPTFSEAQRTQQIQIILRSAKRMNRLIQDLLDVTQIEMGGLKLYREPLDPASLAREAVAFNQSLAQAKSLVLRERVGADLPAISADRDRVLQVLTNLVGNAIKFTPEHGAIEVSAELDRQGVCFAVADTGIGIAEEDRKRLFEPFWQAQPRTLDGVGLGLMISRGIVEAHGGRIWVESTPGEGSTFSFVIPTVMPPAEGERRTGPADRRARGPIAAAAEDSKD